MANQPVDTPRAATSESDSKTHVPGTLFASAARAAAVYTSEELKNYQHGGVRLFVNVTDVGAAGTVTVKIQVKDPVSGTWVDLASAATAVIAANGASVLTVHPSIAETANVRVSQHLGCSWRVVATVAANAVAFSVGAEYLCGG